MKNSILSYSANNGEIDDVSDFGDESLAVTRIGDVTIMAINANGRYVETFFIGPLVPCQHLAGRMAGWDGSDESQQTNANAYLEAFEKSLK